VIRMFADSGEVSNAAWNQSAKYFWPVLYDDAFAQEIGATQSGHYATDGDFSQILRTIIAYSALDGGDITRPAGVSDADYLALQKSALPFGDTAIRAFYDDANDFSRALASGNHDTTRITGEGFANVIAKAMVEYAADLALGHVLSEDPA